MNQKRERLIFLIYIALFLIIAGTLAAFQPLDNTEWFVNPPDEHGRILIPWYIYRHGSIPTGLEEEVRVPGYGMSYGLYTLLPYIIQGYVMRLAGLFTDSPRLLLYAGRSVNVLSGALMACVVWLLSRKLYKDRRAGWLFCFCVTFLPQSLFLHTYVNTDSMCLLSTAVILYALVSAYQEGFTLKNCLCLSAGIIVCALSYYNAYGFILSSMILFAGYFFRPEASEKGERRYDWKGMLSRGLLISAVVLLGIGWQFIRNYILYDGDILGLSTLEKLKLAYGEPDANPLTRPTYLNQGQSVWAMLFGSDFFKRSFESFVGVYGSLSITGNAWMYRAFLLFFLTGLVLCAAIRSRGGEVPAGSGEEGNRGREAHAGSGGTDAGDDFLAGLPKWKRRFFHGNLFFCIAMPVILMIYYSYAVDFQRQGRYAMPILIPLMYYVVRGWQKGIGRFRLSRRAAGAVYALAALFVVAAVIYMTYRLSLPLYLESGLELKDVLR